MTEPATGIEAIESMREESDREFLRRREAERHLYAIKETLRPWWQSDRSNWDGSLSGLPTQVEEVARKIRLLEGERDALLAVCRRLNEVGFSKWEPDLNGEDCVNLDDALAMARVALAEIDGDE